MSLEYDEDNGSGIRGLEGPAIWEDPTEGTEDKIDPVWGTGGILNRGGEEQNNPGRSSDGN